MLGDPWGYGYQGHYRLTLGWRMEMEVLWREVSGHRREETVQERLAARLSKVHPSCKFRSGIP